MKILLILFLVFIIFFIWELFHAGNCCGDCQKYNKCYGKSYKRNDLESPACKFFKERKKVQ